MKITTLTPSLLILPFMFTYCSRNKPNTQNEGKKSQNLNFEGTWELVEYIPEQSANRSWTKYGDSILYQKHLTPDHFVWFKFDTKNEKLLGMGGGKYALKNGQYIEDIKFFYPPGSSELGQAIPFDYSLENDLWYHTGYAKLMEMDSESGDMMVMDSNKIEEKWVKTSLPDNDLTLSGTWELNEYWDDNQQEFVEYPEYMNYVKLITPTHFAWIYYNNEGDEIYAAGSGPYNYVDSVYSETIDLIHPNNSGQIGETIIFETSLSDERWFHTGYIPNISIDSVNGTIVRDSITINERWSRHVN